jgi:hypothetical protein
MGVPVSPKRKALGSAARIFMPRSPSWVRCASSTSTTMLPLVEHAIGLAELEDGRDDDLARVLVQQALQFRARLGLDQVRDVGGVEGGADLRVQVDAIDHDQHGGVAERGLQPQLLRGEDH